MLLKLWHLGELRQVLVVAAEISQASQALPWHLDVAQHFQVLQSREIAEGFQVAQVVRKPEASERVESWYRPDVEAGHDRQLLQHRVRGNGGDVLTTRDTQVRETRKVIRQ